MNTERTRRWLRYSALAVVVVAGLAVASAVLGGNGTRDGVTTGIVEPGAPDDSGEDNVLAQVEQAIGRDSASTANVSPKPADTFDTRPVESKAGSSGSGGAVAPSDSPVASAGQTTSPALASIDDRKIVQTATLKLQVKDVGDSFGEVGRIATAAGGFVAGSNFINQGDDKSQIATATIRVPAARYQDVLGELRALGAKVDAETSNASDVSEQYADMQARLNNLEATETQLLTLLGRANTINEILQVQDRLNSVRSEIEQVKGRMQLFDKLSDLATIGVTLRPVVAPVSTGSNESLGHAVSEAWVDSMAFLGDIAGALVTVVVFAWWLPIVGVPAYVAWRRSQARRSETAPAAQ